MTESTSPNGIEGTLLKVAQGGSAVDLVDQRVLLRIESGKSWKSNEVEEFKVLEVSPSGNWVRLMNASGHKTWRPVTSVSLVEVLRPLKPEPPPPPAS